MPVWLLPAIARYAWPWAVFIALFGYIGYEKLVLAHRARVIAHQQTQLDANDALLRARELEKQSLTSAIEAQNRNVEALKAEADKETVRTVERVRTVVIRDKRKFDPKTVKELNEWLRETFLGL